MNNGNTTQKVGSKVCSTCSVEHVGPSESRIHDRAKWSTSPMPCPECEQKSKEGFQSLGREIAESLNMAVMESATKPQERQ